MSEEETEHIEGQCTWFRRSVDDGSFIHQGPTKVYCLFYPEKRMLVMEKGWDGHRDTYWNTVFNCPDWKTAELLAHLVVEIVIV